MMALLLSTQNAVEHAYDEPAVHDDAYSYTPAAQPALASF